MVRKIFNYIKIKNRKMKIIKFCKLEKGERNSEVVDWLKNNSLTYFNYEWFHDIDALGNINIEMDEEGRFFVLYRNHRMYFKKNWTKDRIKEYLINLLPEQDERSPHLYFAKGEMKDAYNIVVDAGVAEGIFALMLLDRTRKIYLIEPDEEWVEALKITFKDYMDKVVIVNKFLGNFDSERMCSLKNIVLENGMIDLVKLDIEGAELDALTGIGFEQLASIKEYIICVYHYQNEEGDVKTFFEKQKEFRYISKIREGYIYFLHDKQQVYPYLRHGVIRYILIDD